jgi:hypothetical protein
VLEDGGKLELAGGAGGGSHAEEQRKGE